MSEQITTAEMPIVPAVETHNSVIRRVVAAGATVLALTGVAACGAESHSNFKLVAPAEHVALNSDQKQEAAQACPEGFDMTANAANNLKNVGSKESFYPALGTIDSKGNVNLDKPADAHKAIIDILCKDTHALAVYTVYRGEPSETYHLPNEKTINRVNELVSLYSNNDQAALAAIKKASSQLDPHFLIPTRDFVTITGEATQVTPVRSSSNEITGVETIAPHSTGRMTGFEIGYDKVDPNTSDDQKNVLEQLQNLILIDANGRLIIKDWLGNNNANFKVEQTEQTTVPAHANEKQDQNQSQNQAKQNQSKSNGGGGTFGTSNGKGESNQPGNVPESGGNGGATRGKAPSFGNGGGNHGGNGNQGGGGNHGGGGTPPETTPPVTSPPETTPHTTPPITLPPKDTPGTLPKPPSGI